MKKNTLFTSFIDEKPKIDSSAFIATGAQVIGKAEIKKDASIWFNAVIRADINAIEIGEGTNIQDGSILHVSNEKPCKIGDFVTCGHHVNLHACEVEMGCLIGIGSVILTGAKIGQGSIIGAQTLIREKQVIPPGSLVVGSPGRIVRKLSDEEQAQILLWSRKYIALKEAYLEAGH